MATRDIRTSPNSDRRAGFAAESMKIPIAASAAQRIGLDFGVLAAVETRP